MKRFLLITLLSSLFFFLIPVAPLLAAEEECIVSVQSTEVSPTGTLNITIENNFSTSANFEVIFKRENTSEFEIKKDFGLITLGTAKTQDYSLSSISLPEGISTFKISGARKAGVSNESLNTYPYASCSNAVPITLVSPVDEPSGPFPNDVSGDGDSSNGEETSGGDEDYGRWVDIGKSVPLGGGSIGSIFPTVGSLFTNIVRALLAVAAVVFLGIIVWGGFLYLNSGGNPDNAERARGNMTGAIIGLLIVVVSFAIIELLLSLTSFEGFESIFK